jgi:uncharacterized membrane protein
VTGPENERLAAVETKLDDQCARMDRIETKLDRALETKADKSDLCDLAALVDDQRKLLRGLIVRTAAAAIAVGVAFVVYVVQGHVAFK